MTVNTLARLHWGSRQIAWKMMEMVVDRDVWQLNL